MGGNVFKGPDGEPVTRRIEKEEIPATIDWLEQFTGLPLRDNLLGSTGTKPSSGDMDIAVDTAKISAHDFKEKLDTAILDTGETNLKDWTRKHGDMVHFKTPIEGREANGFVQTDFMFGKPDWLKFAYAGGEPNSNFKGQHRNQLLNAVAKVRDPEWKWSARNGLRNRDDWIIANTPEEVTEKLLGPEASTDDTMSVERILSFLKEHDPQYSTILRKFRADLADDPEAPIQAFSEGTVNWFRAALNLLKS